MLSCQSIMIKYIQREDNKKYDKIVLNQYYSKDYKFITS